MIWFVKPSRVSTQTSDKASQFYSLVEMNHSPRVEKRHSPQPAGEIEAIGTPNLSSPP